MPAIKNHTIFFNLLLVLSIHTIGCVKEYSNEGASTVIPVRDTSTAPILPVLEFPLCATCVDNNSFDELSWSFKAGNALLCGIIDNAVVNIERNAFTFFGPSACSTDTNMVISVYLE